ncbi:MAG: hypothetical protein M1828_007125 [Chrysothrix sp. TS-e1954]|nr:MAG: hypothetical protein M1828_007125 [Chrysothrix sp. TS-e1954]
MAPATVPLDPSSAPLAAYFFIAGIESSRIFDSRQIRNGVAKSPLIGATIEEDGGQPGPEIDTSSGPAVGQDSQQHHKRFSYEPRKSVGSINGLESKVSGSNRSSATIRPVKQENGTQKGFTEADFDDALKKFAADRDSMVAELQFAAGQVSQPNKPAPRPRPKTVRITGEDNKSGIGGVRRRISTMNPLSRSNTAIRKNAARTSKRLSGYNSVIPAPQRFSFDANMHPLKRPYEPVLLDRYPPKEETADSPQKRSPFPDYVPMFVFPNDVNVVSADERPKSTWHGFAMTNGDGSKLYGICLLMWIPLHHDAAEELELQCEEWRKRNMTGEERELANSLGERLATERAHLSELLAQLPTYQSDSAEREAIEDEISAVEEKISLMTDLLRPVRHGAASRIPGLTDGESGLWVPRAYGVLGKDGGLTSFWKEWLRTVAVPMTNGGVLRVPPSSPKIGMWQPLERYVINLCAEAFSPITSITQVELAIRDLRLYARKDAVNEIPGCRNTDLYPLFRSLDIPDIIVLFEYVLAESRIILLSSHTSMLHLASAAILQLLYPLKWAGVFIPILPARLIQALEAPCPYIVGIERRYEHVQLPEDDFVLVDLDQGLIEATQPPVSMPRQQRRKLASILQLAAPHRYRYGVQIGPPKYAQDAYPFDTFSSENPSVFDSNARPSNLAFLANLNSSSFGSGGGISPNAPPLFNAFGASRNISSHGTDRPGTSSTMKAQTPPSPTQSPASPLFPSSAPAGPQARKDSTFAIQASLREKRSGVFEGPLRRNSTFAMDRMSTVRRPSLPFMGHNSSNSISTTNTEMAPAPSNYAPSVYAQSTLAASTIMPNMLMQPVHNTASTQWVEGHCMQRRPKQQRTTCSICEDKAEDGVFRCSGCNITVHDRCIGFVSQVCPSAFHPDQVMAAFVRCFASLFYTYRKFMGPAMLDKRKAGGQIHQFNWDGFMKSVPHENADYIAMLRQTQAFNEFIHDREYLKPDDPSIRLFDEIILSKRNRGRTSFFSKSNTTFLADISDHLWRSAAATTASNRHVTTSSENTVGRTPAKLDPALMKAPRVVQGVPRATQGNARRKPVPSMLNPHFKSPKGEPNTA